MKTVVDYMTEKIIGGLLAFNRHHGFSSGGVYDPGHRLPLGILPRGEAVFPALLPDTSPAALMVATDLATRKDAPGIYQRRDGLWVMVGNPVLPGSWGGDYFAWAHPKKDGMDPAAFRHLYMCDPLPEDFPEVPPAALMGERACRECGCTEFNACRHPDHGNCWWVEPDLCSHCANGWGDAS